MKRLLIFSALAVSTLAPAQTVTPNIGLALPPYGATTWNIQANGNFSLIDSAIGSLQSINQGTYASTTAYSKGQIVTTANGLYSSLVSNNLNHTPATSPAYWSLFLNQTGEAFYVSTDGSYSVNNFTYVPYSSPSYGRNVFIGTGAMQWGTGSPGALSGNNIAIGIGALENLVNGGSDVAIGNYACNALNGPGGSDPLDGNDVCLGTNAGQGDATAADSIFIGQKAYEDLTPGSVGGAIGTVIIGVHTDGFDGQGGSTIIGAYNGRYTQGGGTSTELPVTGNKNTIIGGANVNCDFGPSCAATGTQLMVGNTIVGNENLFAQYYGYNSSYAVIVGSGNLPRFNAGTLSGGAIDSVIAIGNSNLASDITGVDNVAIGNNLMPATTSGMNTAVGGAGTCSSTTTGTCTAFGYNAASSNTTGITTAFGNNAASSATDGVDAFGYEAGLNASGPGDVFVGYRSGSNVSSGNGVTDIGYLAGSADGSSNNTYIGYEAADTAGAVSTGGNNTGVGSGVFSAATSAVINDVAVGAGATCSACYNSAMIGVAATEIASPSSTVISGAMQLLAGNNTQSNTLQFQGANFLNSAGEFKTTHGTNAAAGVVALSGGTATVNTTQACTLAAPGGGGCVVTLDLQSCSACGTLSIGTVTNGTSFVINSTSGTDASHVYWEIKILN